jgi:hypothetical protein
MINVTFTLRIQSVNETHDSQGVKIAYGDCSFQSYSKDGLVNSTIPYRAKGSAAVLLSQLGARTCGIAIGYLDLQVIDSGNGYKEKQCTFVIRNFVASSDSQASFIGNNSAVLPQQPKHELVAVAANNNGHLNNPADDSEIPF